MKKFVSVLLLAALALSFSGCKREKLSQEPSDVQSEPATAERTVLDVGERYLQIMGRNFSVYENTHIFYQNKLYRYRGVDAPTDYMEMVEAGKLTHQAVLSSELSTDCKEVDGCAVWHLTGGTLTEDALLVHTPKNPAILYYPEEYFARSELGYLYEENMDGSITILKYLGKEQEIVVPSELDGFPVTAIGGPLEGAFSGCYSAVRIIIPEGVTILNDNTFYGCCNLKSVSFPESLMGIGHCAFNLCPSLQSLYFGGNAPATGNYLFDMDIASADIHIFRYESKTGWDSAPWEQFVIEKLP